MESSARFRLFVAFVVLLAPVLVVVGSFGGGTGFSASPPAQQISDPPSDTVDPEFDFPSMSADGRFVTYTKTRPAAEDLSTVAFVRDRTAATSVLLPQVGDTTGTTGVPAISRDGCKVAYWKGIRTGTTDSGLPINEFRPVVWDRCADPGGTNPAASVITVTNGAVRGQPPQSNRRQIAISGDGGFVAAVSNADDSGVGMVVRTDLSNNTSAPMPRIASSNFADALDISDDGAFIAITMNIQVGSEASQPEVFGWRPGAGPVPVSVSPTNPGAVTVGLEPSVSADGTFVAFVAAIDLAGNGAQFQQLWVRNMNTGAVQLVTDTAGQLMSGNAHSPDMTSDATQIAYSFQAIAAAGAGGLPAEVFVAGSNAGFSAPATLTLMSFGVDDQPITQGGADNPATSATSRVVAFSSYADTQLGATPPPPATPGNSLPGSNNQRKDVWARERAVSLTITSPVDFGTLDVGTSSAVLPATVTNASSLPVPITGVAAPAAPFFVITNGCTGATLPPGGTCVVGVQFRPTSPTSSSGALAVAADGANVSSTLRGTGRTPATTTTTRPATPTTTTVRPATPTTTTRPATTTTTAPGRAALTIAPALLDFGATTVGTTVGTQTFTVTNSGTAGAAITAGTISGTGGDQFTIITNGCAGRTLAVRATCTVTIQATATRAGVSQATFTISASGGLSAIATMRVSATFTPTLRVSPGVLARGSVGAVVGAGFPANTPIQLTQQNGGPVGTPTTDATGAFTFDLVIFPNDPRIGGQVLTAVDQPGLFSGVQTTFLIQLGTFQPSGSVGTSITGTHSLVISRSG